MAMLILVNSSADKPDVTQALHTINTLLGQATAILLGILGGCSVKLPYEIVAGTEHFLLYVLAEYGRWVKE